MTRLRQTIARRLKEAQNTAAMLTTYNEVDMTGGHGAAQRVQGPVREEARGEARLHVVLHQGLLPRAEGGARGQRRDRRHRHRLQELRAHGHRRRHAARASSCRWCATPTSCPSPRSRRRSTSSAPRARDGKLSMAEMQGGTFTISNGGVYGSLMSSPILNPPQSGILGMHKIQERPMVVKGAIVAAPDDVPGAQLRPPHRRRQGRGHLPRPRQGGAGGPAPAADGPLSHPRSRVWRGHAAIADEVQLRVGSPLIASWCSFRELRDESYAMALRGDSVTDASTPRRDGSDELPLGNLARTADWHGRRLDAGADRPRARGAAVGRSARRLAMNRDVGVECNASPRDAGGSRRSPAGCAGRSTTTSRRWRSSPSPSSS